MPCGGFCLEFCALFALVLQSSCVVLFTLWSVWFFCSSPDQFKFQSFCKAHEADAVSNLKILVQVLLSWCSFPVQVVFFLCPSAASVVVPRCPSEVPFEEREFGSRDGIQGEKAKIMGERSKYKLGT